MTTIVRLAHQAILVREKQKEYFTNRKQSNLIASREAEKDLDDLIRQWEIENEKLRQAKWTQAELFK